MKVTNFKKATRIVFEEDEAVVFPQPTVRAACSNHPLFTAGEDVGCYNGSSFKTYSDGRSTIGNFVVSDGMVTVESPCDPVTVWVNANGETIKVNGVRMNEPHISDLIEGDKVVAILGVASAQKLAKPIQIK